MDYYNISDETKALFKSVYDKKSFPTNIQFQFIGNEKQKTLIKITKLQDHFAYLLDAELLVVLNEALLNVFDETSVQILIEQELDKITISIDNGKIKLIKPDLTTFSGIVNKYGIESVARANQVEDLYHKQQQDGKDEFIA
jgi:hypothetical protein